MANDNDVVSVIKYNELLEKLTQAEAAKSKAESEANKIRATFEASVQKLEARATKAEAALADATLGFEMSKSLLADGISDEGLTEFTRFSYSSTPEGDRKPFGEWFPDFRERNKALFDSFANASKGEQPKAPAQPQPPTPKADAKVPEAAAPAAPKPPLKPAVPAVDNTEAGVRPERAVLRSNYTPQQLASMSPKDAVAHLREIGLTQRGGGSES